MLFSADRAFEGVASPCRSRPSRDPFGEPGASSYDELQRSSEAFRGLALPAALQPIMRGSSDRAHPPMQAHLAVHGLVIVSTILVIEDDTTSREAIRELLVLSGYMATGVPSKSTALDWCRRNNHAPSVVVCDYLLPDNATGVDVVEEIRAFYCKPLPAILVTGLTASEIAAEAQQHACKLLRKPISTRVLLDCIESSMASSESTSGGAGECQP